jgi:hypothetical protein
MASGATSDRSVTSSQSPKGQRIAIKRTAGRERKANTVEPPERKRPAAARPAEGLPSVGRAQQQRRRSIWPPGTGKRSRNLHNRNATGSREARDTQAIRPHRSPQKSNLDQHTLATLSDNSRSPNGRAAHGRRSWPANTPPAKKRPKIASAQSWSDRHSLHAARPRNGSAIRTESHYFPKSTHCRPVTWSTVRWLPRVDQSGDTGP